ncbi:MAG: transglutaminase family protein [Acidimicrobiales bacterium]|jgi:transglutaminase-like putative cysteine protease|nr:transglutaminase family protein [Acidimicrobiales bacterium]
MADTGELRPEDCLRPTRFLDCDHPAVRDHARGVCEEAGATTERHKAVALFLAVRDGIRYDPYAAGLDPDGYRASTIVRAESAYCVPKAVLLSALCRAEGIPAALGFADVRNHLQSEKLRAAMGTDVFVFHGYSELWLGGRWVKVSSAFNRELCERFGTRVLEFDGEHDALLHPFDESGHRHMEYVRSRGSYADLPYDEIMAAFAETYGEALLATDTAQVHDEAFGR